MPERDLCLWAFFIGTPCSILELNRIQLGDVITKSGVLSKSFVIRGEKSFTGDDRKIYLTNKRLSDILANYISNVDFPAGEHPDYYGGRDPSHPLFITKDGKGFALTAKKLSGLRIGYKPDSLRRHIMNLMKEGGIENPNAQSGRRTFATKLHRNHRHISQITHLLGDKTLETTKRLIGNDPVDMGAIAAEAF